LLGDFESTIGNVILRNVGALPTGTSVVFSNAPEALIK
jgi:hypothetical protein